MSGSQRGSKHRKCSTLWTASLTTSSTQLWPWQHVRLCFRRLVFSQIKLLWLVCSAVFAGHPICRLVLLQDLTFYRTFSWPLQLQKRNLSKNTAKSVLWMYVYVCLVILLSVCSNWDKQEQVQRNRAERGGRWEKKANLWVSVRHWADHTVTLHQQTKERCTHPFYMPPQDIVVMLVKWEPCPVIWSVPL